MNSVHSKNNKKIKEKKVFTLTQRLTVPEGLRNVNDVHSKKVFTLSQHLTVPEELRNLNGVYSKRSYTKRLASPFDKTNSR